MSSKSKPPAPTKGRSALMLLIRAGKSDTKETPAALKMKYREEEMEAESQSCYYRELRERFPNYLMGPGWWKIRCCWKKIESAKPIIAALRELIELDDDELANLQAEIRAEFYGIALPPTPRPKKVSSKAPVTVHRTPPFMISSSWTDDYNKPPVPKRSLLVDLNVTQIKVDWPKEGEMYGRQKALEYIKQTPKHSKERSLLIQYMSEWRFVPSEGALYGMINEFESSQTSPTDAWKKRGRPKKSTGINREITPQATKLASECIWDWQDHAKPSICERRGWMGRIDLHVTPIDFSEIVIAPSIISALAPRTYDICYFLGNKPEGSDSEGSGVPDTRNWHLKICRMYFNPTHFPPPEKLSEGGKGDIYAQLKHYIKQQSNKSGSPVVCTSSGTNYKVFSCKMGHRKEICAASDPFEHCPFGFQLRWDNRGYYIHLRDSDGWYMNIGSGWHCCAKNTASASEP